MVSFSLSSHKWSLIGLFKFIIIIHLKSFIKVVYQETCYLGTTVVAGGDLEGGKRSGFWTQGPSLLKLSIKRLINTMQKWNEDLRKGRLSQKKLLMWFIERSRKNGIYRGGDCGAVEAQKG